MVIRRAATVAWAIMLVSAVGLSEAVNCDTYTDCQTCSDNVNTSGDDCVWCVHAVEECVPTATVCTTNLSGNVTEVCPTTPEPTTTIPPTTTAAPTTSAPPNVTDAPSTETPGGPGGLNGGDSSSGAESSIFEWNKSAVAILGGIVTIIVCCIVINIGHYIARKKLADRDFFKEYLEEDTTRAHMKDIIVKAQEDISFAYSYYPTQSSSDDAQAEMGIFGRGTRDADEADADTTTTADATTTGDTTSADVSTSA